MKDVNHIEFSWQFTDNCQTTETHKPGFKLISSAFLYHLIWKGENKYSQLPTPISKNRPQINVINNNHQIFKCIECRKDQLSKKKHQKII